MTRSDVKLRSATPGSGMTLNGPSVSGMFSYKSILTSMLILYKFS